MPGASQGFLPLRVVLSLDSPVSCVYVKQHLSDHNTQDDLSSIFVAGLPFLSQGISDSVAPLFESFGSVKDVVLHPTQLSAVVSFQESDVWTKFKSAVQLGTVLHVKLQNSEHPFGLKGWVQEHQRMFPGNAALRQQLDDWLVQHEEGEAAQKSAAEVNDGWTVVRRRPGRRKTTDAAGTAVGAVASAAAEGQRNKKQPKVLHNFYKFQQRDQRRSEIMDLQEKFERDKRKITELKAVRRFKPY